MPNSTWNWRAGNRHESRMKRPLPIAVGAKQMVSDPEANLALLEAEARACTAFGKALDFDANVWAIANAKSTASRVRISLWFTRLATPEEADKSAAKRTPLSPKFAVFAKSVIRLVERTQHYEPPLYDRILRAFRFLFEALVARGAAPFPWELRTADFESAAEMAEAAEYAEETCRLLRVDLERIARICFTYRLTWDEVDYHPPTRPAPQVAASGDRNPSLPSPAVISALAKITAEATTFSDIILMSAMRVIQVTHFRSGDALRLGIDCEVFVVDGSEATAAEYDAAAPEERRYGLRYFDEKLKRWDLKPVMQGAVAVVRDAIQTARLMSAPSRVVARHYASCTGAWLPRALGARDVFSVSELADAFWKTGNGMNDWINRNRVPVLEEAVLRSDLEAALARTTGGWPQPRALHAAAAELLATRTETAFASSELAAALPVADLRRWLRKLGVEVQPRSVLRAEVERALVALQPDGRDLPVPLEHHLFLFPANAFAAGRQTFMPVAEPLKVDQLRIWLRGTKNIDSVFRRFECREADGRPIIVTAHAFRAWLITGAGANMSAAQLREWTNHACFAALGRYLRETEAEIGEQVAEIYRRTNMEQVPEHWKWAPRKC